MKERGWQYLLKNGLSWHCWQVLSGHLLYKDAQVREYLREDNQILYVMFLHSRLLDGRMLSLSEVVSWESSWMLVELV